MGPLKGIRILEVASLGPGPFAAMMLADMGADVLRLERIPPEPPSAGAPRDLLNRGRPSVGIDLKQPAGVETVLSLCEQADALLEGFRPGVMERLGLGPEACWARNAKLVYGRMTGWGQEGPLAARAGHDINYIALSGALHAIGRAGDKPVPPLNLVGDFGGGGMLLAFGVVCAVLEAQRTGRGQVVDAAMVDGASLLMTMFHSMAAMGVFSTQRGHNLLDSGAPFYETYETRDGQYMAVGALEPKFYGEFLQRMGLADADLAPQMSQADWPALKQRFAEAFKQKTRAEWTAIFEGSDACVTPVLDLNEAADHAHARARGSFVEVAGLSQPAPAPRFSETPAGVPAPPSMPAQDTDSALQAWGISAAERARLKREGVIP